MNNGEAYAIFKQIESDKYTDSDKLEAINRVLGAETHNGITKDDLINAFKWFHGVDEAWNRRVQPELTRCEKCVYWDKSASYMSAHACAFWSSGKKTRYTENHEFCSFAERKEE